MTENGTTATAKRAAQLSADGKTLAVYVPMQFRKRGGRKVVMCPSGAPEQISLSGSPKPASGIDRALVKTLAQAFHWQHLLDEGRYATVGDLARSQKLDPSFVARILRLTLIAPDIVEAILNGRQAAVVQRQMLMREVPLEWNQQRQLFRQHDRNIA